MTFGSHFCLNVRMTVFFVIYMFKKWYFNCLIDDNSLLLQPFFETVFSFEILQVQSVYIFIDNDNKFQFSE